jgi:uncharacterized repeat protein (TIGR01451 family)
MKIVNRKTSLILRLGITATALLIGQQAMAEGTRAGTLVSNTATVDYDVATVAQTQLPSNTVQFAVDRRVDFTLAPVGGALVPVTPGGNDYFFDLLLTNTSNSVLDFNVAIAQMAGGLVRPAQTDDADMATFDYAVSADFVSGLDPDPVRLGPQYVDELEADDAIRIRVFGDAGFAMTNGQIAGVELTVNGADGGAATVEGAALLDGVANTDLGVENVFADAGLDNSEVDRDGFIVVSAALAALKAYTVIDDGGFGTTLPIPGATIEYSVAVTNTGATGADAVQIGDVLDASVSIVLGSYNGGASDMEYDNGGVITSCTAAADGDECEESAGVITVGGGGTITVAVGDTLTLLYRVLILDPATTP